MTWRIIRCLPRAGSFLYLTTLKTGVLIVAYSDLAIELFHVGQALLTIFFSENILEGSEFTANMFEDGTMQRIVLTFAEAIIMAALAIVLLIGILKNSLRKVLCWLKVKIITFIVGVTISVIAILLQFVVSQFEPIFQPVFFVATKLSFVLSLILYLCISGECLGAKMLNPMESAAWEKLPERMGVQRSAFYSQLLNTRKLVKDLYFMVVVKSYYFDEKRRSTNNLVPVSSQTANSSQSTRPESTGSTAVGK